MGLLGALVAGGVKGYADQRIKDIETEEAFNMKKALMDAETDKQIRLKEAGIKAEEDAQQRDREKVSGIINSVKDPNADKGGYETDEMKTKSKRDMLERQVQALKDNGRLDEAKGIASELSALDKAEYNNAQLDAKLTQIQNAYALGRDKLESQGKLNEANIALAGARTEATLARAGAAADKEGKMTEKEKLYRAYADDVKTNGRKDRAGKLSKVPMSFDKWEAWRFKKEENGGGDKISETVEYDPDSNEPVSRKVTTTGKSKPAAANQPVRKYVPGKGFQ